MRRYLLFCYDEVFAGGWNDFIGSYDYASDANEYGLKMVEVEWCDYYHVIDTETLNKVYSKEPENE